MKPIRVGVIGGGWGQLQIEAFSRVKGVEVAAICDLDVALAEKLAKQYKIPSVYKDYDELIGAEVDWVSVASPPQFHSEIIHSALVAGKHVLTEKPVSLDANTTKTLISIAEEKGLVHAADLEMRFLPANMYIKELVDEDYVGRVHRVDVTMAMENPWGEHGNWAVDLGRGGGILAELGSHFIDLICWWFGEISSVVAATHTFYPSVRVKETKEKGNGKTSPILVTGDDSFWCVFELAGGGEATMNFVTGARHDPGWTVAIYGSQGSFISKSGQLWSMREGDREMGLLPIPKRLELGTTPNDPLMWSMVKLFECAVARIRRSDEPVTFPTFGDALRVQELIEAVRVSSVERRWVTLHARN